MVAKSIAKILLFIHKPTDYLCCTLSALRYQCTTNICRPYSSSNKEQIVNIRKRKIRYFILNISVTLLVCSSNALNKSLNCVCTYKILATKQISLEVFILW